MDKLMVGFIIGASSAFIIILIISIAGNWVTGQEAVNRECAHYDLKTGRFTWNKRIGEE